MLTIARRFVIEVEEVFLQSSRRCSCRAGNFGTVFVDQSYWQCAVAAKPNQGVWPGCEVQNEPGSSL